MALVDPYRGLLLLQEEQAQLSARIDSLTPAELEASSNLRRWSVQDLIVHVTCVCDAINAAIQRAVVGDRTGIFGAEEWQSRELAIRAQPRDSWCELQRSSVRHIVERV